MEDKKGDGLEPKPKAYREWKPFSQKHLIQEQEGLTRVPYTGGKSPNTGYRDQVHSKYHPKLDEWINHFTRYWSDLHPHFVDDPNLIHTGHWRIMKLVQLLENPGKELDLPKVFNKQKFEYYQFLAEMGETRYSWLNKHKWHFKERIEKTPGILASFTGELFRAAVAIGLTNARSQLNDMESEGKQTPNWFNQFELEVKYYRNAALENHAFQAQIYEFLKSTRYPFTGKVFVDDLKNLEPWVAERYTQHEDGRGMANAMTWSLYWRHTYGDVWPVDRMSYAKDPEDIYKPWKWKGFKSYVPYDWEWSALLARETLYWTLFGLENFHPLLSDKKPDISEIKAQLQEEYWKQNHWLEEEITWYLSQVKNPKVLGQWTRLLFGKMFRLASEDIKPTIEKMTMNQYTVGENDDQDPAIVIKGERPVYDQAQEEKGMGWTPIEEFRELLGNDGVHIGAQIGYNGDGHILTIGRTRSGKGVNITNPHILGATNFEGSQVILDVKGELTAMAALTQQLLPTRSGKPRKVVILDPFGIQKSNDCFHSIPISKYNPLSFLNINDEGIEGHINKIAESLTSGETIDHWNSKAVEYISRIMLHMLTTDQEMSIENLLDMVAKFAIEREELAQEMLSNSHSYFGKRIRQSAASIKAQSDDGATSELGSINSVMSKITDGLRVRSIEESTKESDFEIEDLLNPEQPMTLFICIPESQIQKNFLWVRLVIYSAINAIVERGAKIRKEKEWERTKVLFLLEEFPQLKYFHEIAKGINIHGGYGITYWMIAQDLEQLRKTYKDDWKSILGACWIKQYLSLSDDRDTLENVSLSLGERVKYIYKNQLAPGLDLEKLIETGLDHVSYQAVPKAPIQDVKIDEIEIGRKVERLVSPERLANTEGKYYIKLDGVNHIKSVQFDPTPFWTMGLPFKPVPHRFFEGYEKDNEHLHKCLLLLVRKLHGKGLQIADDQNEMNIWSKVLYICLCFNDRPELWVSIIEMNIEIKGRVYRISLDFDIKEKLFIKFEFYPDQSPVALKSGEWKVGFNPV